MARDHDNATEVAAVVTDATGTEDLDVASSGDVDSAVVTEDAGTVIDIPEDPGDGISITPRAGEELGIGLPGDGEERKS